MPLAIVQIARLGSLTIYNMAISIQTIALFYIVDLHSDQLLSCNSW